LVSILIWQMAKSDDSIGKVRASSIRAGRSKSSRVEELVEALGSIDRDLVSPESQKLIHSALTHKHWMPVEQAARLIAQHSLPNFTQQLLGIWERFLEPGSKLDPGCRAKESALVALDAIEWFDPDPFLAAIRYRQLEPGFGGPTDTAGGVRQRALFALLRQHHSFAVLFAGELLADPLIEVRIGTADALGQYGGPNGAPLLVQRLRTGDDSRVLLACASALIELEDRFARELLGPWLRQDSDELREVAALALGQSKSGEAGELLIAWFDEMAWERDVELAARALALHRSERARRCLLTHIANGSVGRARAAVRALSAHRYDPRLCESVREATQRNGDPTLIGLAAELYPRT
jgi:hypothetical protein